MLRFEFVQGVEFDDPQWHVYDEYDNDHLGFCHYDEGFWFFQQDEISIGYEFMLLISKKLSDLNISTKQQRILGFL